MTREPPFGALFFYPAGGICFAGELWISGQIRQDICSHLSHDREICIIKV